MYFFSFISKSQKIRKVSSGRSGVLNVGTESLVQTFKANFKIIMATFLPVGSWNALISEVWPHFSVIYSNVFLKVTPV